MKNIYNKILYLFVLATILYSCQKEAEVPIKDYPMVFTNIKSIDSGGVWLEGIIKANDTTNIKKVGFIFGETLINEIRVNEISDTFEYYLNTDIKKGTTYQVQAFIETDNYKVFGNTKSFVSEGYIHNKPIVNNMFPLQATDKNKITITGQNFSFLDENTSIKIGDAFAIEYLLKIDTIIFLMPPLKDGEYSVKLKVYDSEFDLGKITVMKPRIDDFYPKTGFDNTLVTVKGKYFGDDIKNLKVYFGTHNINILNLNDSIIQFYTPFDLLGEFYVNVDVTGKSAISKDIFKVKGIDITPHKAKVGDIVTITCEIPLNSATVWFNNTQAIVKSIITENKIEVYVPSYTETSTTIKINTENHTIINKDFVKLPTWIKIFNFVLERAYTANCVINEIGYLGFGCTWNDYYQSNDWWKFNPTTMEWTQLKNFPISNVKNNFSFVLNEKCYLGVQSGNYEDLWEYTPTNDSWIKKTSFNKVNNSYLSTFVYENKAYILADNCFYIYTPETDTWTQQLIIHLLRIINSTGAII